MLKDVKSSEESGKRRLLGAFVDESLIGTGQLIVGMLTPNWPHRAEISKMVVYPDGRRHGLGKALMIATLGTAKGDGKILITPDPRADVGYS